MMTGFGLAPLEHR